MVLILSQEDDGSTTEVINWLKHLGTPYFCINRTSILHLDNLKIINNRTSFTLKVSEHYLNVGTRYIQSEQIRSFWYRRGYFSIEPNSIKNKSEHSDIKSGLNKYLREENQKVIQFLNQYFRTQKHLNSYLDNNTNKLHNLSIATTIGLNVPYSLVTSSKIDFLRFKEDMKCEFITKAINVAGFDIQAQVFLWGHTEVLTEAFIEQMPEIFGLSLFQQFVEKAFDLRIFYLDGNFYSSAILSQSNEQTKIDFRQYDDVHPNRIMRYQLPTEIENKLRLFMKTIDMNCGSVDMVKDRKGVYYFLEVNPIGQYGFISNRCNYDLNKEIAKYLS
jgi:ATP-GRASP peptide maturase of grasp-with-spasm system